MDKINEGQTQVYLDGRIEKQYGVDDNIHDYNVPNQLLDIIRTFKRSNKDDRQILSILVGMGISQKLILNGLQVINGTIQENTKQKTQKMNFNLLNLYENINSSYESLKKLGSSDNQKLSYSSNKAADVLESVLNTVPNINIITPILYENDGYHINLRGNDYYIKENIVKQSNEIKDERYNSIIEALSFASISNDKITFFGQNNKHLQYNVNENTLYLGNTHLTDLSTKELRNKIITDKLFDINESNKIDKICLLFENKEMLTVFNLMDSKELLSIDDQNINSIKEDFDNLKDSTLKWKMASDVYNSIKEYSWINPVKELGEYLDSVYENNKWGFHIYNIISSISSDDVLHNKLKEDLTTVITESDDMISSFKNVVKRNPWAKQCSSLLREMESTQNKSVDQGDVNTKKVLTPILHENNGYYINLRGKNYFIRGNSITEASVKDVKYNNILEALSFAKVDNDTITFYGQGDKFLQYNMNEGTLFFGDNMNLTESSITELRTALMNNRLYHFAESNKVDKVCLFFESIDMLTEMDNMLNLTSTKFPGLFLTLISIDEGVWVNKTNFNMNFNEMKFYDSAEVALNETINFIGYDPSSFLMEKLIKEGNKKAQISNTRNKLNSNISKLEEKKKEVELAIKQLGESEELTAAMNLIDKELYNLQKSLQETYMNEGLSKAEIAEYQDEGFVEAHLKNNIGPNFSKDDIVMVDAEEYTSLGKDDLLKVINPETGENKLIHKEHIKIHLDEGSLLEKSLDDFHDTGKVDSWSRPIYKDDEGNIYVDIDLGKSKKPNLHTVTQEGEPLDPVRFEY